jgi:nitrogen fixation protein FixH
MTTPTPFTVGQEVTMPHTGHTAGGVIESIEEVGGEIRCRVRDPRGVLYDYRDDALYARRPEREAARDAANLTVAQERMQTAAARPRRG